MRPTACCSCITARSRRKARRTKSSAHPNPSAADSSYPKSCARNPTVSEALIDALNPALFWEYRLVLLRGLAFNAYVFFAAATVALSVGLAAALLRVNRAWPFRWMGTLHVEVFRNAPDYIMVIWVH